MAKSLSQVWEWRALLPGPDLKPGPPTAAMGRDVLLSLDGCKELQGFSHLHCLLNRDSLGGFGCWLCW